MFFASLKARHWKQSLATDGQAHTHTPHWLIIRLLKCFAACCTAHWNVKLPVADITASGYAILPVCHHLLMVRCRTKDMRAMLQGSAVVLYNWLKRETLSPHTWVTDYMNDLALPVNFVGLSTEDRRFIYPQKEVSTSTLIHYLQYLQSIQMSTQSRFTRPSA